MDLAQQGDGLVFVSFGSVAKAEEMPDYLLQLFLKAFGHFKKFNFLWKFDLNSRSIDVDRKKRLLAEFGKLKNVHPSGWLDQMGILGINFMHLFIIYDQC